MDNSRKKQRLFAPRPKVREARFLDFFRKKDSDPQEGNEEGEGGSSLSDLIKGKGKGKGKAVVVNGPLFTIITTVSPEVTRTIVATSVVTLEPSPPPPPPPPPPPTSTAVQEPPKTLTPIVPVPVLPVITLTPLVPTRSETQAPQESSSSLVESSSSLVESTTTLTEPSSTTADIAVDAPTTFSTVTMPPAGSTPYAGGWSPEATDMPTGLPAPVLNRLSSGQVAGIVAGTAGECLGRSCRNHVLIPRSWLHHNPRGAPLCHAEMEIRLFPPTEPRWVAFVVTEADASEFHVHQKQQPFPAVWVLGIRHSRQTVFELDRLPIS